MQIAVGARRRRHGYFHRVIGPDGGKPSFGRALLRETIGRLLSGFILDLGHLSMLRDERQQSWHDKMTGTHVVRA